MKEINETTLYQIISLLILWVVIGLIVGSYGKKREIGFEGAFWASILLSPVLAMLFVLASNKLPISEDINSEK